MALTVHRTEAEPGGDRELKKRVHNRLLESIDVSKLETLEPDYVHGKLTTTIRELLEEEGRLLTDVDRDHLIEESATHAKLHKKHKPDSASADDWCH